MDDRIAAGGMGEVWRATDTVLGRDVAVKTLHAGRAGDPGFQTRFRHEARAMAVLQHPGVADVYDYGQSGPDAYIVMARVNGQALNERIAERGRLSAAETMSIVAQAGRALEAAHQAGIVHRDVKPGNLIIQPDGTVVLVDFGVARSAESAALTGAKEVVGTALYIAPEQVSKETTGPSADVYALGVVAYHCLAGHPPFMGDSPIAVAVQHVSDEAPPLPSDVPPRVAALVSTAMVKDPADRFPSASAMADTAELALADQAVAPGSATTAILAATPAPARPASPVSGHTAVLPAVFPPSKGGGRGRTALMAALVLVILGTAVAVFAFVNGGLLPGSTPAESATTKPGGVQSPAATHTTGKRGNGNNNNPGQAPASKPGKTTGTTAPAAPAATTKAPTKEPTAEPTTAAPEETTPTTAAAPAATETTGGDSGTGGGEEEGAAAPTATP
ncbi:putative serine/threonine-protein kinase PknA [Paractinoplanes tereljensis]|uniref:non-specific serine/threonine protein kinase n=1 Tax=Paractinoplanes tereljensis TaxID=571912 RepID=A0A919TSP6_9ACTN|nr:putative serine/threonine-protein kinase PknA [Actinoplanes tereljensis]